MTRRPASGRPDAAAAPRRPPDDTGAVAVVTAVLVSAVLLTVGALTVDLGSAWAERVGLRALAETAAVAGAGRLPPVPGPPTDPAPAVAAAVRSLCADGNRRPQWGEDAAGCTAAADPGWATDGDQGNGEVLVEPAAQDAYPGLDEQSRPWLVRVVTPPVRVDFGLARTAGVDHVDLTAAAAARRGLPWPTGGVPGSGIEPQATVSPFYLTLDDLEQARARRAQVCLRAAPLGVAPAAEPEAPDPTSGPAFTVGTLDRDTLDGWEPAALRLTGARFGAVPTPTDGADVVPPPLVVRIGDRDSYQELVPDRVRPAPDGSYEIELTTPDLTADRLFGEVRLWFEYDDGSVTGTSDAVPLTYPADPDPPRVRSRTDCDPSGTGHGLARPAPADGTVRPVLGTVRDGLATPVLPFGSWPRAQRPPAAGADCYTFAGQTGAVVRPEQPGQDDEAVNCLQLTAPAAVPVPDLTTAWLGTPDPGDPPGRLERACSGQRDRLGDGRELDTTDLFGATAGLLVDPAQGSELEDRVRRALAPTGALRGAISADALDCGRLLLVPVLDPADPADPAADPDRSHAVVALTYLWVDDPGSYAGRPDGYRGLITTADERGVLGVRGWVVDPRYVRGGDWVAPSERPEAALPMAVPRSAVLVRSPCDDHPDTHPDTRPDTRADSRRCP